MHSLEASCKLAIVVLGVLALQRMDAEKRQKKKKRRIWTKAWLRKRDLVPPAASIRDLPEKSPDDFRNYLRMADESYQQLLRLVSPRIQKKDTHMRSAIPAELRLRATLQYLATGRSFEDLKFMLNIAAPTLGKIIPETCQAIIEALSPEYLKFPQTAEEWKAAGQRFEEAWQFPNCGGAIVGKHVRIHPPAHSGSYFYNHKGYFSIVLLAIVNANHEFVYVDVGKNGRTCAGGVLDQTEFSNRLKNGQLNLPSRAETKDGLNFVFVADKAFALGEHLLKPFPVKLLSNEKRIFNSRLSRARSVAENAFDALANRFRIFQTTINLSVHKIDLVVHACCVLHNFLHRSNPEYLPPAATEGPDGVAGEEQGLASLMPTMSRKATGPARENRNKYMKYFMGDGAVDWQNDCLTT